MNFKKKLACAIAGVLLALGALGCGAGTEESASALEAPAGEASMGGVSADESSPGIAQSALSVGETRWRTIGCCLQGSKQVKEEYLRSGAWRPVLPFQYRCYGVCAF